MESIIKRVKNVIEEALAINHISDYTYTVNRYKDVFGYIPDLNNPRTFNEKLNWRKLYDRKKIHKTFADKVLSKKYVSKVYGKDIIPEVIQISQNVKRINKSLLPKSFIIKATHGSGWNKIVFNKEEANWSEVSDYFSPILKQSYYELGREWCYKGLKPRLIIEELLLDQQGKLPLDYKFFCFNGKVKFVQVDYDRFGEHTRNLYDRRLNQLACSYLYPNCKKDMQSPSNYEEMVKVAEKISAGLDFIRVDLFNVSGKIYFGELTNYPENGYGIFTPKEYDLKFGSYWKIDDKK